MKCTIPGQNAIILAKSIHSFARIGNELFLEANLNSLSLRTVNLTKSAFAMISFDSDFFSNFVVKSTDDPYENRCKLAMKSCLGVFRNMKQVESCTMTLDTKAFKLIVQFKCRLETIKTHHISILEQETLQAAYVTDKVPNVLIGNHKLFNTIVSNFKINEEELSIKATDLDIVAQNYVEGSNVDNRFVRSQITLKPDEFENYKITENTTITFCMRELRAILHFAESLNISVSANFETGGKPVVFVIKKFDAFEANLVMSTLSPEDEEELECQPEQTAISSQNVHITQSDVTLNANPNSSLNSVTTDENLETNVLRKRNRITNQSDTHSSGLFEFGAGKEAALDVLRKKRKTLSERDRRESCANLPLPNNYLTVMSDKSIPKIDLNSEDIQVVFQDESEVINLLDNDENNDLMPIHGSQIDCHPKRNVRDHRPIIRQTFKRCFTADCDPSPNEIYGKVLAECSDEDE